MKQKPIRTSLDVVTEAEKRDLHDELLQRNRTRREAWLPLLDIDAELAKEVAKVAHKKFETELEPYLLDAYERIPSRPGFVERLRRRDAAYHAAEVRLRDDRGLVRGYQQQFDLVRSLIQWQSGKLNIG